MPPRLVALLVALALLLVACSDEPRPLSSPSASATTSPSVSLSAGPLPTTSPSPSPTPTDEPGPQVEAFLALCSVTADVADGDLVTAEATFHDEVHEALHELTDELEGVDRELSAALLQAKSRVEADFAEDPQDATDLEADIVELIAATDAGLAALGVGILRCPEQVT